MKSKRLLPFLESRFPVTVLIQTKLLTPTLVVQACNVCVILLLYIILNFKIISSVHFLNQYPSSEWHIDMKS